MSKSSVWIFVEGKTDNYFYSKLAEAAAGECGKSKSFIVASADELAPNGGGKSVLLRFFDFLKSRKSLVSRLAGKETRAVFALDKDVDDLLAKRKVSPHIIYTEFYSMENYLFRHGDLADASSVLLSVPIQEVRRIVGDATSWRIKCASLWQDWATLCLYASKSGSGVANFKSPSRVNVGNFGPVDHTLLSRYEASCLAGSASLPNSQELLEECRERVLRYYDRKAFDRVFNGKWYALFLESHFARALPSFSCKGFAKKVSLHLAQTLDFGAPWARKLRLKFAVHLQV